MPSMPRSSDSRFPASLLPLLLFLLLAAGLSFCSFPSSVPILSYTNYIAQPCFQCFILTSHLQLVFCTSKALIQFCLWLTLPVWYKYKNIKAVRMESNSNLHLGGFTLTSCIRKGFTDWLVSSDGGEMMQSVCTVCSPPTCFVSALYVGDHCSQRRQLSQL